MQLSHKTIADTSSDTGECHQVPCLPCKTTAQPLLKPSRMRGFAACPLGAATPREHYRESRRDMLEALNTCSSKIKVFLRVLHEPQNQRHQKRCFVRGFRQFSSHAAKCHACCGFASRHASRMPWQ